MEGSYGALRQEAPGSRPVKCAWCDQEMRDGVSCKASPVEFTDGTKLDPVPYVDAEGRRCHDCCTPSGGIHHPGCDMERCPRCGGQVISCGCVEV